ncbi:MAG: lytic transglycosylase domain-containing protein [Catenulispora sp.]
MSGISGSGNSGRHVASHAKPGKISNAKGKAKTAAAVTSVLAVSGGVATAFHLHQDALRNSTEAASQDSSTSGAAAAAAALSTRSAAAAAANRDAQRPDLNSTTASGAPSSSATQPGAPAPSSDAPSAQLSSATGSASAPVSSSSTTTKPPTPTATSSSSSSSSVGTGYNATPAQAQAIAKQLVPSGQYACFANIISRESSWNIHAVNPSSGAYGLPQALPGYKMADFGADWRNSATIQIKWALSYMTGRYGSPCAAWAFWQNHNWY